VPRTVLIIKSADVKFGAVPTPPAPIDPAALTDYSCQVVEARITATPNTTDVPATFCEPASKINVPSSFDLELQGLQDWGDAASLSQYLFDNDATQAAFALYLDDTTDPEATGIVSLAAGDFGGVAGEVLVMKLTLPILGKPTIGTGTTTLSVEPEQAQQPEPEPVPA
jgi:hypothetical protein